MDPRRPLVIVNPRSGGGLSEAGWARLVAGLTDGLGPFDSVFTTAPRDATDIARREAAAGRRLVVAFGGDGTISETADGILAAGAGATTELGIIPRGTGGDFRRSLELPERSAGGGAATCATAPRALIDAGRVHHVAHDGAPAARHFVNVASFGFSSAVASRANASSKRLGGKLAFLGATVRSLLSYDNTDVWLRLDDGPRQRRRVLLAAVGNGRFFGGGMKICPRRSSTAACSTSSSWATSRASTCSRRWGASTTAATELGGGQQRRRRASSSRHPSRPTPSSPSSSTARRPGRLPATFEILPGALRLRVREIGTVGDRRCRRRPG